MPHAARRLAGSGVASLERLIERGNADGSFRFARPQVAARLLVGGLSSLGGALELRRRDRSGTRSAMDTPPRPSSARPWIAARLAAALALVLAHREVAHAQASPCTVAGRHVSLVSLEVSAAGMPPLRLETLDVDATLAVPVGEVQRARAVTVAAPLVFEARATRPVQVSLAHPVDLVDGVVHLAPPFTLRDEAAWDGAVVHADVGPRGTARIPAELACDALTLDARPAPRGAPPAPPPLARATTRLASGSSLRLFARSGGQGASVEVHVQDELHLPLELLATRGGWAQVRTRWDYGSRLQGFVELAQLRRPSRAEIQSDSLGEAFGYGGLGVGASRTNPAAPGIYHGSASVAADTAVSSAQTGGVVWARTARELTVQVYHRDGEDQVAIESVPGLTGLGAGTLSRAWVPLNAVRFPRDVVRRGGALAPR